MGIQTEVSNAQLQPSIAADVVGASWDQTFIAEDIIPSVDTGSQRFIYERWDNAGLIDQGKTKRGLHAHSKVLRPAANDTVEAQLEEASAKIPLDVNLIAAAQTQDNIRSVPAKGMSAVDRLRASRARIIKYNNLIQKEKDVAEVVFTATNYDTNLKTTALSFKTCKVSDIKDAMNDVRRTYGFMPDTFVLGWDARISFDQNSNFLDRITGGSTNANPATVSDELLAQLLGVKRIKVGLAMSQTKAAAGAAGTPTDLWTADSAALIYTGEFEQADLATPAFAKQFFMNVPETGLRYAVWSWMDAEPNTVEWQKAAEFYLVKQTMPAGYHFTNADQ